MSPIFESGRSLKTGKKGLDGRLASGRVEWVGPGVQEARPTLTFLTRLPPPILTCRPTHALARSDCWQSHCKAKDNENLFVYLAQ